jgi:hypothetical protein
MMASLKMALALLVVGGAAAILLPSWAPAQPDPTARLGVQQTGQPPGNLDKIKQDLERAAKELARTKEDLDRMTKEYEAKVAALKAAMEQVKRAEEAPAFKPEGPGFGKGFGGGPNLDKRLAEIERKLDAVMEGMEKLQKLLGKNRGAGAAGLPDFPVVPGINEAIPAPAGKGFAPVPPGPRRDGIAVPPQPGAVPPPGPGSPRLPPGTTPPGPLPDRGEPSKTGFEPTFPK